MTIRFQPHKTNLNAHNNQSIANLEHLGSLVVCSQSVSGVAHADIESRTTTANAASGGESHSNKLLTLYLVDAIRIGCECERWWNRRNKSLVGFAPLLLRRGVLQVFDNNNNNWTEIEGLTFTASPSLSHTPIHYYYEKDIAEALFAKALFAIQCCAPAIVIGFKVFTCSMEERVVVGGWPNPCACQTINLIEDHKTIHNSYLLG